jgi:hypothetical protein
MHLSEDTLYPVDGLGDSGIDGVVVVDVHIFESLHLQRIDINIERQQIKGEVSDIYVLVKRILLEELLADDGAFGPEAGVVFLIALVPVQLDELLENDEVLAGGFEEDHDLVVVGGYG